MKVSEEKIIYRAYHNESNQLVEVTKERLILIGSTIQRLKAFIIALETKLTRVFDFAIQLSAD